MSQYFPKPFNSYFGDSIKVKIDLSNYRTKTDIKNISHVDTSSFALKTNLANLKTDFVYCKWSVIKNKVPCIKFSTRKETKIW